MRKLLTISLIFVATLCVGQDSTYLPDRFFLTNWIHKSKLSITINQWQEIEPIKIKNLLYMVPYGVYLENKALVESRIDLNRCVIRKVRRNELIEVEFKP